MISLYGCISYLISPFYIRFINKYDFNKAGLDKLDVK